MLDNEKYVTLFEIFAKKELSRNDVEIVLGTLNSIDELENIEKSQNKHLEIVKILQKSNFNFTVLETIQDPNPSEATYKTLKKVSLLHLASRNNNVEVAKWLIEECKIPLDITDGSEETALHHACKTQNLNMVRFLLNNRADIKKENKDYKQTPVMYAICSLNVEIFDFLFNNHHIDATTIVKSPGATALHQASFVGNIHAVERFIDLACDINTTDKRGQTPLHYAANLQQIKIMPLLLKNGADPRLKSNDGAYKPFEILREDDKKLFERLFALCEKRLILIEKQNKIKSNNRNFIPIDILFYNPITIFYAIELSFITRKISGIDNLIDKEITTIEKSQGRKKNRKVAEVFNYLSCVSCKSHYETETCITLDSVE